MSHAIIPNGYIPFQLILAVLHAHKSWELKAKIDLSIAALSADEAHKFRMRLGDKYINLMPDIVGYLSPLLASGEVEACGISELDGSLIYIPAQAWRMQSWEGERLLSAIEFAFEGKPIRVPRKRHPFFNVVPLISELALAEAFIATNNVPNEPILRPHYLPEYAPPPSPSIAPATDAIEPHQPIAKGRGGRPPKHDWDSFWVEVVIYAAREDVLEDDRPRLQRHMEAWTAREWVDPPDAATIRRRLAPIFARGNITG